MKPLGIFIVEDHEWTTLGLKTTIEMQSDHRIIATANNGANAVKILRDIRPDIILMDIEMPDMDGITATQLIKEICPDVKILMLTSYKSGDNISNALSAGADGYCMKDIKIERLIKVMETVYEGGTWFDPGIGELIKALVLKRSFETEEESTSCGLGTQYHELTVREMDVLEQITLGKSNKEIAESLCITIHTVKIHVANILNKLEVADRTQLAIKALQDKSLAAKYSKN